MASSAGLPQPGVEVIQVFQTVSPTVITPTLVPCIVGACNEVVDAVISSATGGQQVNSAAQVELPGFFVSKPPTGGPPAVYALNGNFEFSSNGLPLVTVNFVSGNYTPAQVVTAVQAALAAIGETNIEVLLFNNTWMMRTTSETGFDYILISPASTAGVLTAFGLYNNEYLQGASDYEQYEITVPTEFFPNPFSLATSEVSVEVPTVRAFLGISGNSALQEALRTQTVSRHGGATTVIDAGNGTGFSNIIQAVGQDFLSTTTTPSVAVATAAGTPDLTGNLSGKTIIMSDGRVPVTVQLPTPCTTIVALKNAINAAFNPLDGIVASGASDLVLTSTRLREDGLTTAEGEDSNIVILGGSAVYPTNYLDTNVTPTLKIGRYEGNPVSVQPGDQLWVDGVLLGTVSVVGPNGQADQLRINANKPLTFTGLHFYIVATNLSPLPGEATGRPKPDLIVDAFGDATFKHDLLRDMNGAVVESTATGPLVEPHSNMYISFKALRLDVTDASSNPGLLTFSDPTTLQTQLAPITTDNPLGLGLYFAMLNAPAIQVTGVGVNETSPTEPFGTVQAFTDAASFLEQFEVYAIAPLTHESTVHQVFQTHVDTMSQPDNMGERIVIVNPSEPTARLDTLVASGTDGNTIGNTGLSFDTGISNLSSLLLAAGITNPSSIPVASNVYLSVAGEALAYNITAVNGSVVTVNVTFTGGQNQDGFYSTVALPVPLIEDPFSVKIRGAKLVLSDGETPDKPNIAATYAALAQSYLDHRVWLTVPDTCAAIVSGVEQQLDGFYMNAAIAGMIGQQPPQQSFTNYPMTGFTRVIGSNQFFTRTQLNQMAGGGCYIIVQDVAGISPLYSRMALTTDLTSIETRTDSITKVVDFCAKFFRQALKAFIGRFNINQGLLDSLGHVLQGLIGFLVEAGVLIGATVNNIIQDTSAPDTVLIDITLDVPFPCNYIRLTLVI